MRTEAAAAGRAVGGPQLDSDRRSVSLGGSSQKCSAAVKRKSRLGGPSESWLFEAFRSRLFPSLRNDFNQFSTSSARHLFLKLHSDMIAATDWASFLALKAIKIVFIAIKMHVTCRCFHWEYLQFYRSHLTVTRPHTSAVIAQRNVNRLRHCLAGCFASRCFFSAISAPHHYESLKPRKVICSASAVAGWHRALHLSKKIISSTQFFSPFLDL